MLYSPIFNRTSRPTRADLCPWVIPLSSLFAGSGNKGSLHCIPSLFWCADSATNEKNKVEAALDAVLADEQPPAVVSAGAVLSPSSPLSAATTPAVTGSASAAAATSSPISPPEQSQEDKQKLSDIDMWVEFNFYTVL